MNEDTWAEVEELFERCVSASPSERESLLASAREQAPDVVAEVRSLLAFEGQGTQIDHVLDAPRERLFAGALTLEAGQRFASYTLVRHLGSGGMGTVWLAERDLEGVHQQVALKLLNEPQSSTRSRFLERFDDERRILAGLDHPNVARLIDSGTSEEGAAFYAMEFVDGRRLTDHCSQTDAELRQRILLFLDVCRAVEHAHRRFVIHRDIKPDNILVDGEGRARLLDFGIAKLQEATRTDADHAGLTRPQERLLTPNYASPEQVLGEPVTTASDVYSLGVVLYELLTGAPPRRLEDLPAAKMAEVFTTNAPRASTVVTEASLGEGTPGQGHAWSKRLRGDLDTILAKALQTDADRRYADATALIDDLERYLQRRPIRARPDSNWYRLQRFCQRNAAAVVAASIGTVLVLAAGVGLALQARSLRLERDRALEAEASARTVIDFLTDTFQVVDPSESRGRTVTARELLDRGAERIDEQLVDQPGPRAELTGVLAEVYRGLGLRRQGLELHRTAADLASGLFGDDDLRTALALSALGNALREDSQFDAAQEAFENALAIQDRLLGPDDPERGEILGNYGLFLWERRQHDQADPILREALALRTAADGAEDPKALTAKVNFALNLQALQRYDEAEQQFREVVVLRTRTLGEDHPATANVMQNLGGVLRHLNRLEESAAMLERSLASRTRTLGTDHPLVGATHNTLAATFHDMTELDRAATHYQRAIEVQEKHKQEPTAALAYALGNLADLETTRGNIDRAERLARRSVAAREAVFGQFSFGFINGLVRLGIVLLAADEPEAAATELQRAYDLRSHPEVSAPGFPASLFYLGQAQRRAGWLERAERSLNTARDLAIDMGSNAQIALAMVHAELAELAADRGDAPACRESLARANEIGADDDRGLWQVRRANRLVAGGRCAELLGNLGAARSLYQEAASLVAPLFGDKSPVVVAARKRELALD